MNWLRACLLPVSLLVLAALLLEAGDARQPGDITNSSGMKFKRVEAGEFVMGLGSAPPRTREEWTQRDGDEAPAHPVRISKPFYLGVYEVTNAQYEKFD